MSRASSPKRGRGRPRREYRIRVRGERRAQPDYDKLARALLEHAAMEEAKRRAHVTDTTDAAATTSTKIDGVHVPSVDIEVNGDADD
jgi:predicted ArsR family transcriptional regulator